MKQLMTTKELAEAFGWHPGTIHNRRHAGQPLPPAIKLGNGQLRWREEDVEAWLNTQAESSEGPADVAK